MSDHEERFTGRVKLEGTSRDRLVLPTWLATLLAHRDIEWFDIQLKSEGILLRPVNPAEEENLPEWLR